MAWKVEQSKKIKKAVAGLPPAIKEAYDLLVIDLEANGPEAKNWHHFGKFVTPKNKPAMYHCHLNKGKNRYVAVWRVRDFTITIMEMHYVGTHENADYTRLGRI